MNTTVVRGRAELLVTGTGMQTEVGRIAEMLTDEVRRATPLERQLHRLGTRLAMIAGVAVTVVFALNMALNAGWCWSFFKFHQLGPSVAVAGSAAIARGSWTSPAATANLQAHGQYSLETGTIPYRLILNGAGRGESLTRYQVTLEEVDGAKEVFEPQVQRGADLGPGLAPTPA